MSELQRIQEEIKSLPKADFAKLYDWILDQDWEEWDKQIEKDSLSGKLDFLINEALEEIKENKLKTL